MSVGGLYFRIGNDTSEDGDTYVLIDSLLIPVSVLEGGPNWRFEDSPLFRTVLARDRNLLKPFFLSFSSFGADAVGVPDGCALISKVVLLVAVSGKSRGRYNAGSIDRWFELDKQEFPLRISVSLYRVLEGRAMMLRDRRVQENTGMIGKIEGLQAVRGNISKIRHAWVKIWYQQLS